MINSSCPLAFITMGVLHDPLGLPPAKPPDPPGPRPPPGPPGPRPPPGPPGPRKFGRGRASFKPSRSLSSRSEEHTSELQSHSDLVCRLLLEKKKEKKGND